MNCKTHFTNHDTMSQGITISFFSIDIFGNTRNMRKGPGKNSNKEDRLPLW